MRSISRPSVAGAAGLALLLVGSTLRAQPVGNTIQDLPGIPQTPVTLSNVVVRIDGQDEIGLAKEDFRVYLIEHLRARGFHAVGAESLVFGKDDSAKADFRVGGIVREAACKDIGMGRRCSIGIEWQLLDVSRDAVVYTVMTRAMVLEPQKKTDATMAKQLMVTSLDSLLGRATFRRYLENTAPKASTDPTFPKMGFASCKASDKSMPEASERVLNATVIARTARGHGSGFFVSPDGLVITAAHVLDGPNVTLRMRDGRDVPAVAIRVAKQADVALLRPVSPVSQVACLAIGASPPVGAEVYVAGAPADQLLASSLTRGIVSAMRDVDGQSFLQTDASVSPGNSGGPMVDGTGNVVGVTQWKVVSRGVEGVAFGTPAARALAILGLEQQGATDPALLRAPAAQIDGAPDAPAVHDTPDPPVSVDPEGDRVRAAAAARTEELAKRRRQMEEDDARSEDRDRRTPTRLKVFFWGGLALAGVSAAAIGATAFADGHADTTRADFNRWRVINTLGWVGVAAGITGVVSYFLLRPPVEARKVTATSSLRLVASSGSLHLLGDF